MDKGRVDPSCARSCATGTSNTVLRRIVSYTDNVALQLNMSLGMTTINRNFMLAWDATQRHRWLAAVQDHSMDNAEDENTYHRWEP